MSEATYYKDEDVRDYTPVAAVTGGEVIQLADGRAAYAPRDIAAGILGAVQTEGVVTVAKTTSMVILNGGRVFWDVSASKSHYRPESGTQDFYIGTAVGDAASADTTMKVALNCRPNYTIDSRQGIWTADATLGLGVTMLPGGGARLEFDAVAEAAQAAMYSDHSIPSTSNPIFEGRMAIFNIGDDAALDIDFGLASGSHATDFEAVANFVTVHLDGNALDIKVHSDDGTTDVAAADSLIDAVDDTYFEVWIDCRDTSDVQVYVNGVDAVPAGTTLTLAAASNNLKPIAIIEKTSNDTVADVRVDFMRVRTADQ